MIKKLLYLFLLSSILTPAGVQAQLCGGHSNHILHHGEEIRYKVFYTLSGAWIPAGEATFTTASVTYEGRKAFHIVGTGRTYSSYDWIFKVRDKYETYIDQQNLRPLRFKRDVQEGKVKFKNDVRFSHADRKAFSNNKTFSIKECTQDVLSTIYFARNLDYSKYKAGDKINFSLFLDDELYNLYIQYLGKTNVKTRYGTFKAIKLSPLLVEGNIFKGGDKMILYVSDDKNRIPLRIETPILVGSIKVDLMSYKNLQYPLSSKIN